MQPIPVKGNAAPVGVTSHAAPRVSVCLCVNRSCRVRECVCVCVDRRCRVCVC